MATLAERIKLLRKENNLTQEEFGKLFGVVKSTVSMYESGKSTPDDDTKQKIANYFCVTMDYLMGRTDVKNAYSTTGIEKHQLTKRDEKEIEKIIEQTRKQLESTEGLMFDGNPATPEAIESILQAMEIGMAMAKKKNKEKYTPKKYRKDK